MRSLFFDPDHRLRNGWWMLVFVGFIAVTRFAYGPVTQGMKAIGLGEAWREPAPFLFTLLATWACTRLRRENLASVGFDVGLRWLAQLVAGAAVGVGSIVVASTLIGASGGVRFELDPDRTVGALVWGAYVFLFAALLEENLFRGFLFQRLVAGTRAWVAQVAVAALFAVAHWGNPGMAGATMVVATADIALGALIYGLAYLRTRSLALPVGMHLGWNFAQGPLLGFGVSGTEHGGWVQPVFLGRPEWLTGGAFGPEASVFAVLVDLVVLASLWRWRGAAPGAPAGTGVPWLVRATPPRVHGGSHGQVDGVQAEDRGQRPEEGRRAHPEARVAVEQRHDRDDGRREAPRRVRGPAHG